MNKEENNNHNKKNIIKIPNNKSDGEKFDNIQEQ
jgi:hypothetical protein